MLFEKHVFKFCTRRQTTFVISQMSASSCNPFDAITAKRESLFVRFIKHELTLAELIQVRTRRSTAENLLGSDADCADRRHAFKVAESRFFEDYKHWLDVGVSACDELLVSVDEGRFPVAALPATAAQWGAWHEELDARDDLLNHAAFAESWSEDAVLLGGATVSALLQTQYLERLLAQWVHCGSHGCAGVSLLLLDERVDPSANFSFVLRAAARFNNEKVFALLLADPRVQPGVRGEEAFLSACAVGNVRMVAQLLARPDVNPMTLRLEPMVIACKKGNLGVIELLLADPRTRATVCSRRTISEALFASKSVDIVALMLNSFSSDEFSEMFVEFQAQSFLQFMFVSACSMGNDGAVALLLQKEASFGLESVYMTAMRSSRDGSAELTALLADRRCFMSCFCDAFRAAASNMHAAVLQQCLSHVVFCALWGTYDCHDSWRWFAIYRLQSALMTTVPYDAAGTEVVASVVLQAANQMRPDLLKHVLVACSTVLPWTCANPKAFLPLFSVLRGRDDCLGTYLDMPVRIGDVSVLQALLESVQSIDTSCFEKALQLAAERGDVACFVLLFQDPRADILTGVRAALLHKDFCRHAAIARLLRQHATWTDRVVCAARSLKGV